MHVNGKRSRLSFLSALPLAPQAHCRTTMSQKKNKQSTHARDMLITAYRIHQVTSYYRYNDFFELAVIENCSYS